MRSILGEIKLWSSFISKLEPGLKQSTMTQSKSKYFWSILYHTFPDNNKIGENEQQITNEGFAMLVNLAVGYTQKNARSVTAFNGTDISSVQDNV